MNSTATDILDHHITVHFHKSKCNPSLSSSIYAVSMRIFLNVGVRLKLWRARTFELELGSSSYIKTLQNGPLTWWRPEGLHILLMLAALMVSSSVCMASISTVHIKIHYIWPLNVSMIALKDPSLPKNVHSLALWCCVVSLFKNNGKILDATTQC